MAAPKVRSVTLELFCSIYLQLRPPQMETSFVAWLKRTFDNIRTRFFKISNFWYNNKRTLTVRVAEKYEQAKNKPRLNFWFPDNF